MELDTYTTAQLHIIDRALNDRLGTKSLLSPIGYINIIHYASDYRLL